MENELMRIFEEAGVEVLMIPPDEEIVVYDAGDRWFGESECPIVDRDGCYVVKVRSEGVLLMDSREAAKRWYLCRYTAGAWSETRAALQEHEALRGLRWRQIFCNWESWYGEKRPIEDGTEYRLAAAPAETASPSERTLDRMLRQAEDESDLDLDAMGDQYGDEALLRLYDRLLKQLFDKDRQLTGKIDEARKLISDIKAENLAYRRELRQYMDKALAKGKLSQADYDALLKEWSEDRTK